MGTEVTLGHAPTSSIVDAPPPPTIAAINATTAAAETRDIYVNKKTKYKKKVSCNVRV